MTISCIPCRSKKRMCDKGKPKCVQCSLRNQPCIYNVYGDKRRRSHKEFEEIKEIVQNQEEIIATLLREDKSSEELAEKLKRERAKGLKPSVEKEYQNKEVNLEHKILTADIFGKVRFYGETSNLPMIIDKPIKAFESCIRSPDVHKHQISDTLVSELLNLYFCWQHTYYNILNRTLFLRDMLQQGPFFSEFLFNCILTHASHISDRIECRAIPDDPTTTGDPFYQTAIRLLADELENASVTTVQGLLLLASRESGVGKNSLGWIHSGMAFRIAIDLGLHLNTKSLNLKDLLSKEELEVRNATFWGCYVFDKGWSFYLGRPCVIQDQDITLEFPQYVEEESETWSPFYEDEDDFKPEFCLNFYPHNTSVAIVRLYQILQGIISDVYSSTNKSRSESEYKLLLEELNKRLIEWEKQLPQLLRLNEDLVHPAIIMLHTMYYSAIIFLNRPFFKVFKEAWRAFEFPDPMEVSKNSAAQILNLLMKHKNYFTLKKIPNLALYVAFTAFTMSEENTSQIKLCKDLFEDLGQSWCGAKTILEKINDHLEKSKNKNESFDQFSDLQGSNLAFYHVINSMFGEDFGVDWNSLEA